MDMGDVAYMVLVSHKAMKTNPSEYSTTTPTNVEKTWLDFAELFVVALFLMFLYIHKSLSCVCAIDVRFSRLR